MQLAKTWVTIVPGSPYMGPTAPKALQRPLDRIVGLRISNVPQMGWGLKPITSRYKGNLPFYKGKPHMG